LEVGPISQKNLMMSLAWYRVDHQRTARRPRRAAACARTPAWLAWRLPRSPSTFASS